VAATADILGVKEEAARKRLEPARRKVRDYLAAEVEDSLESSRPDDYFSTRTLAAIPIGSICGKIGLHVIRPGVAEAVRQLAHAEYKKQVRFSLEEEQQ